MSASLSNGYSENTTKDDKEFEPGVNEPYERAVVKLNEQLKVLPENEEEEKEEILLTASTVEKAKPKMSSSSKAKSSRTRRREEISSANVREQLERQTTKIRPMLQSIQKDTKSTPGQLKLIQSQLKQLQSQLTQIQKIITKKGFAIGTTASRKKTLDLKRLKKKR